MPLLLRSPSCALRPLLQLQSLLCAADAVAWRSHQRSRQNPQRHSHRRPARPSPPDLRCIVACTVPAVVRRMAARCVCGLGRARRTRSGRRCRCSRCHPRPSACSNRAEQGRGARTRAVAPQSAPAGRPATRLPVQRQRASRPVARSRPVAGADGIVLTLSCYGSYSGLFAGSCAGA